MKDYTIRILQKINRLKDCDDIKVFIDGVEIKKRKDTFVHMACEGKHTLRIEEVRYYKNKYSYALIPFYFFDTSLLDKSPFYAVYETEFYLDKDIDITVTFDKEYIEPERFVKIMNCSFNVVFDNGVENHLLKNDFIASNKERKHWLVLNIIVITLPITLLICLFSIFAIKSIKLCEPIFRSIFVICMIIILIVALIFLINNYYANYKNDKYKFLDDNNEQES